MSRSLARLPLSGAILLALLACASKAPQPTSHQALATDQEIEQAQHDYASCLERGAATLDHGKLPAASVAREVRSYCLVEFQRIVELRTKQMSPEARDRFKQTARAGEQQEAMAAVLRERNESTVPGP